MAASRRGWTQLEGIMQSMGCTAFMAILAAVLVPNFIHARFLGQWTACKSNLKNIGTALEMYSTDNQGRYPLRLQQLLPTYLKQIPTCPTAESDTYSVSYQQTHKPDNFSYSCQGHHHSPDGDPSYECQTGLHPGPRPTMGRLKGTLSFLFSLFLSVYCAGFLGMQAFVGRPEPLPRAASILRRRPLLDRVSWLSWVLLCGAGVGVIWYGLGMEFSPTTFCISTFLGPLLAQLLVRAGNSLWAFCSPAPLPEPGPQVHAGAIPGLRSPVWTPVLLTSAQRRKASVLTFSLPFLSLSLLTILPSLGQEPDQALRGSLLGLAAGVLLVFPAYLWARHWGRLLFERRLEWVPGSGDLLLHASPWGSPVVVCLGTQAEIESLRLQSDRTWQLTVGGMSYRLPPGEFIENLQGHLPPDES